MKGDRSIGIRVEWAWGKDEEGRIGELGTKWVKQSKD